MPTINVNNTTLYYRDSGATERPPLLCLHSLFLDGTMYDDFTEAAEGTYRVIRPDFRGQGRSSAATSHVVEMETLAADIEDFIDELGLDKVDVIAQSMGGDVILRVASKRPELFRSLSLLGSSACDEPPEQLEFVEGLLNETAETGFVGEHLETLMAIMFGESSRSNPAKADTLKYWRGKMAALPLELWPAIRGVVHRGNVLAKLPQISAPVLIISGAEDMVRLGAWQDDMAHALPKVRHLRLPRVGHSIILEAPEPATSEILSFLNDPYSGIIE